VSSTVKDLVAGSGIEFEDYGQHELKGVHGSCACLWSSPERPAEEVSIPVVRGEVGGCESTRERAIEDRAKTGPRDDRGHCSRPTS
jgi:hypothetical protein